MEFEGVLQNYRIVTLTGDEKWVHRSHAEQVSQGKLSSDAPRTCPEPLVVGMSSAAGHTQETTPDVATSSDSQRPGNDRKSVERGQKSSKVVKAGPRSGQEEFKRGQRQVRGQG